MSPATVITFAGLLIVVFLVIAALLVWQEARRRPSGEPLEYVVEDAVKHIQAGLGETSVIGKPDIRRILEYELFYLQGLAQKRRSLSVETVAGGHQASVEFIAAEIEKRHGAVYDFKDIEDVLRLEAVYLLSIGAIGDPVSAGEEE